MMPKLTFFGDDAMVHHVGLAVKSINPYVAAEIFTDIVQNVRVAFVDFNGVCLELIEPLNDVSPICQSLKKGIKLLHICYEVTDIDATLRESRKYGFHCIRKPVRAAAFGGRRIVWVYSTEYGLFELLEKGHNQEP